MTGIHHLRRIAVAAVVGAGLVAPLAVASSGGVSAAASTRTVAAPCTAQNTRVWLGLGEGGAAAGSIYMPLEFSNVGSSACSLDGHPGVSAFYENGSQLASPASWTGSAQRVTLQPGGTAHATLRMEDGGISCSMPDTASGLRVYPPNQTAAQEIHWNFQMCPTGVHMSVSAVQPHTGIPGLA